MMIVDGRGKNQVRIGQKNLERIRNWFTENPEGTQTECAIELGLDKRTIHTHVKTLRNEGKCDEDYAKIHYIKGILKNKFEDYDEHYFTEAIKYARESNVRLDSIQNIAKDSESWTNWLNGVTSLTEKQWKDHGDI